MTATFFRANDNNNTKYFLHTERVGTTTKDIRNWMDNTIATYEADGFYTKVESSNEVYFLKGEYNSVYVLID